MGKKFLTLFLLAVFASGSTAITGYQADSMAASEYGKALSGNYLSGCLFYDGTKYVKASVMAICDSLGGYGCGKQLTYPQLAVTTDLSVDTLGAATNGTKVLAFDTTAYPLLYLALWAVQDFLYLNIEGKALFKYSPTGVVCGPPEPAGARAAGLFPNPFRQGGTVRGMAPGAGKVTITVYNILGQKVRSLECGASGETFSLRWDGRGDDGRSAAAGVYYIRVKVPGLVMPLLKAVKVR
jgi:hypothetical protein